MNIGEGTRGPLARAAILVAAATAVAVVLSLQSYLARAMRGELLDWAHFLAVWMAWAYAWAALTPPILWLVGRFPLERPQLGRALALHSAAGAIAVALNLALFALAAPYVDATSTTTTWFGTFKTLLATTFFLDLPVYWAIAGGAQAVRFARAARERERRLLRAQAELTEASLLALRAQLQPHFLFNALNTVSVLMREDVDAADRVLVKLSELLRRTLDAHDAHEVRLRDEIELLEAYLEIEHARFSDRLSYQIDVEPELLDSRVPSLILQPLVENAVRHGVARRVSPGRISVAAGLRDGRVQLTVRDDGPGLSADATDGVGLTNTRARLEQLYGDDHRFVVSNAEGGGVVVILAIPLRTSTPK